MLIYREQRTVQDTTTLLSRIRTRLCDLPGAGDDRHDRIVTVIIELGLVEAGVADALHPEIDATDPISGTFRRASTAAGHLLWNSWRGHPQRLASWSAQLEALL